MGPHREPHHGPRSPPSSDLRLWTAGEDPAIVVDAALGGRIQLVTSHDLLDELRTSTRVSTTVVGSADRRFDVATEVVKLVMEVSIVFVPIRHATRARDADDNRVLDAAAAGSVDVIISGDADLLSLREYNGTPICGASDFVARMLQGT